MPRPIWSGSISFGLVNVPVKLFSAVSSKDVRFHQLERSTGARIRQRRVSSATGEEVPYEEIVKGYELGPDRYVAIDPAELDALDPKATKTIDIEDFVDLDMIDPIYYERPYYLVPDRGGSKAYKLLLEAMRETNKVAIARMVLRTKQYLAALRPRDNALVLETMLFNDEVVPLEELDDLPTDDDVEVSERELKMARQLIDSLASDFEPDRYHDEYREKVLELIEQKASGQEIVVQAPTEEPTKVVDLMAALEASLAAAQEGKGKA
jgi:DNA end-binding protein Ku